MTGLILQIPSDILDNSNSTITILHKAKIASFKLNQQDFLKWINLELDGYEGVNLDDLLKYRILSGMLVAQNPYHGWVPAIIQDAGLAEMVSRFGCWDSIAQISHMISSPGQHDELLHVMGEAHQKTLRKLFDQNSQFAVRFPKASFAAIIDHVRSTLLNWTLELEKSGVIGENLQFSQKEQAIATPITQNVFATNIGMIGHGGAQSVAGGITQTGAETVGVDVQTVILAISRFINELPSSDRQEAQQAIVTLESKEDASSAVQPGIRKQALQTLRRIAEGSASTVAGQAILRLVEQLAKLWP